MRSSYISLHKYVFQIPQNDLGTEEIDETLWPWAELLEAWLALTIG